MCARLGLPLRRLHRVLSSVLNYWRIIPLLGKAGALALNEQSLGSSPCSNGQFKPMVTQRQLALVTFSYIHLPSKAEIHEYERVGERTYDRVEREIREDKE